MVMCNIPFGGYKKLSINDDIVPDSAFLFACRLDVFGICLALSCWVLEFSVLVFFNEISQEDHPNTAYVSYVPDCGDNGGQPICTEEMSVSAQAIATSFIILLLTIGPDFVGGLNLALSRRNTIQVITGCAMMVLAIVAGITAVIFNMATTQDDVAVYTNCVAILFVLDMDEQLFRLVKMIFPTYVEETIKEITATESGSSAIGIVADVRFAELMEKHQFTGETEMTKEVTLGTEQQCPSPTAGAPLGVEDI